MLPQWKDSKTKAQYIKSLFTILNDFQTDRLQQPEFDWSESLLPENTPLNRYRDILPFNYNRFQMTGYINASRVESIHGKQYIASQGPLPHTTIDFWDMVRESGSRMIVMLTTETEKGRTKCHRYWPDEHQSLELPNVVIKNSKETVLMNSKTIHRSFEMSFNNETRKIDMIHFLDWPDHQGSDPKSLLEIIHLSNSIYEQQKLNTPIIVHCSAGVGRTGTFCVVDSVLHHMKLKAIVKREDVPNFPDDEWERLSGDIVALTVNHFRQQRICMVQSEIQFQLCYDAILLFLSQ